MAELLLSQVTASDGHQETPEGRPPALGQSCRTGPGHWPLTWEVGGPAPCGSSAASRVSAKGNAFSPLSKDSSLGISRPAGVGEHPQHEGLLPPGAQAGITNRARWSLVILPCGALGGSSHEMGLVCCPSEPLALAQLAAPFGQVFICKGWGHSGHCCPSWADGGVVSMWVLGRDRGHGKHPWVPPVLCLPTPDPLSFLYSPQSLMSAAGGAPLGRGGLA